MEFTIDSGKVKFRRSTISGRLYSKIRPVKYASATYSLLPATAKVDDHSVGAETAFVADQELIEGGLYAVTINIGILIEAPNWHPPVTYTRLLHSAVVFAGHEKTTSPLEYAKVRGKLVVDSPVLNVTLEVAGENVNGIEKSDGVMV